MRRRIPLGTLFVVNWLLFLPVLGRAQVGEPLTPWSAGTLEIHQISTGRGNSALFIFPDGTTLLVDAGDQDQRPGVTIAKPSASRRPGEWIARYVRRMLAHDPNPSIDYALMTHLHGDHIGAPRPESKVSRGGYKLTGISEVAEHVRIRTLLDRAWPDYNYPTKVVGLENYRAFLDWQRQNAALDVQRFQPGRNDQIRLRREPGRFPTFEVRNIAANGEVWTGVGTTTRQTFPRPEDLSADDYPTENSCSTVLRLSYGKFDYFTGGDLTGAPDPPGAARWTDMETTIAPAVGPLDVLLLNHHGMYNATNERFLNTVRPRVVMISSSGPLTPDFGVVTRLLSTRVFPGPRDIFTTGILAPMRAVLPDRLLSQFKSTQGHIVVRVDADGETFRMFVLDDSAENFVVKAVHGPYTAR